MTESPKNEGIYQSFADGYDLVMRDVDYERWAEYVLNLMALFNLKSGRILNFACGTGSAEAVWAEAGSTVVGIDQSSAMIERAIAKHKQCPELRFQVGDMRTVRLGETFDTVICLYDSLNYLTSIEDVRECFHRAAEHLEKGGGFIFDVATESNILESFTNTTYADNFEDFAYIWENEYNIKTKICRSDFYFFQREPGTDLFKRNHEIHYQRMYSHRELVKLLRECGFEYLASFDGFTQNSPQSDSERIHFAARKL